MAQHFPQLTLIERLPLLTLIISVNCMLVKLIVLMYMISGAYLLWSGNRSSDSTM